MAKLKYNVSDVEEGVDFDQPLPRGVYRCKVSDIEVGESKSSGKPMMTVEYEVTQKEGKGRKLWDYIVLDDSSAWKLKQFTDALGLKAKGTLDTDKAVGERVLVRVKHETDNRDPDNPVVRGRVGNVSAVPSESEAEDVDDVEDTAGDSDDYTWDDLLEYERDELEELIEEEELEVKFNKKTNDDVLRERVAEALEVEVPDEDDEDEDGDDEDGEEDGEAYEDMTNADLKAELKARGLSTKGPKSKMVERLEKDDEDDQPF